MECVRGTPGGEQHCRPPRLPAAAPAEQSPLRRLVASARESTQAWATGTAKPQFKAVAHDPGDALWGGLKQVLNDVISVGDLAIQVGNGIGYGLNSGAAKGIDALGFDEAAANYHARNAQTFSRIRDFELPKAALNGDAEKGGALIVTAAETATVARAGMSLAGTGVHRASRLLRVGDQAVAAGSARTAGAVEKTTAQATGATATAIRITRVGRNQVEWHADAEGRIVRARAVLREVFSGLSRSSGEKTAQRSIGKAGLDGDHGGHIIDHRFLGDQGPVNMFPQNGVPVGALKNFNGSAYRTMMNELSNWVKAGAEVRVDIRLGKMDASGRPGTVYVNYDVYNPATGKRVYFNRDGFENSPGQVFERRTRSEIQAMLEGK